MDTLRSPVEDLHQEPPPIVSQSDPSSRGMVISGDKLVFSPPLYAQRYQAVQEIITASKMPITKVVDIGSAELKFFRNLRYINGVQEVVLVDVDEETLQSSKHRVQPLMADFLLRRQEPLTVKVVCGDARVYDPLLSGAQVVTLIEVIEHMNECDLPALVQCVFQHVRPHLVVVTTPNADFNKFFPNHTPGKFRHWDHKFEWTAQEFQHWCLGVVEEYQDYTVEFSGCGLGPDGTFCTQVATFWHHTQYQEHSEPLLRTAMTGTSFGEVGGLAQTAGLESVYKIIAECEYPVDKRTKEEWEVDYAMNRFNSLRNFLVAGDRQGIESSVPVWQQQDGGLGLPSPPDSSLSSDCIHYLTPHFDNEEAVYKAGDVKNEYCFYIIDNRYALIPMRSLAHWVNSGAETDLTDELISRAVGDECFETHGSSSSWVGKVMLYEERVSSSSRVTESDSEDTSYARWPSMETLHHNTSHHSTDVKGKLQIDVCENDIENWD
ncbi:small RNA 2'-O-methyltransferase-like isoform X3 [Scylla paramamosain]